MLRKAHSSRVWIAIGALIASPLASQAAPEDELAELRNQIEQIRREYGERIGRL